MQKHGIESKGKCNQDCLNCSFEDCILSENEAFELENKKSTYKSEFKLDDLKSDNQIQYETYKDTYKAYRDSHKEEAKVYQREYYQKNKEKIKKHNREKQRSRYLMNTENEREKSRLYYQKNREKILAKKRAKTAEKRRLSELEVNSYDCAFNVSV